MKNIKSLVTVALAVVIIGSCKKEDPTPTTTPTPTPSTASKICRVKTLKYTSPSGDTGDTIRSSASYEYNTDGKVSKISSDTSGVLLSYTLYDYSTKDIVDVKSFSANGTQKSHTIYKLGSNGYASCSINGDNLKDTLYLYEYNTDGHLIKGTKPKTGGGFINIITNGNVTQEIIKDNAGVSKLFSEYEYTDKPDKNSNRFSFRGKGNTNLSSKETMTMYGTTFTFSYTLNNEGYPLEKSMTLLIDNDTLILSKTYYTYSCQ